MDRFINSVGVAAQAATPASQVVNLVFAVAYLFLIIAILVLPFILFRRTTVAEEPADLITTYRHVPPAGKPAPARRISWAPTHRPTIVPAE